MRDKTLKVLINGNLVGCMTGDLDIDTPWVRGPFQPTPFFSQYASLFASLGRAYAENHYDEMNQLNDEVNRLEISIEDEEGKLLFASNPSAGPIQRITAIRIQPNEISWRPA